MRTIPPSELPVNEDGSVFHLHLRPEQLAEKVVMMGDPERVASVAAFFDDVEFDQQNREFRTVTGHYRGKRITALSHGIGCDNLDIVINELDALVNIDLVRRTEKPVRKQLTMVRIGTCGGLQPFSPVGSYIVSKISMGMDGLLYFYDQGEAISDKLLTAAFCTHTNWPENLAVPYFVYANEELTERIGIGMLKGITCSANGFYGPQGRYVRLPLARPDQNQRLESFLYEGLQFLNYEMESAALAGLSKLMGHRATTVCLVIANRHAAEMNTAYKGSFNELIIKVLDRI
ncbi:MAG: nucleoside phosphorylase [Dysgonamonadaceae bacterium]|jgi:uridine phosphorylase|nr:nucleoside phosphorylase [Dysgonamonadaceae bacterium]